MFGFGKKKAKANCTLDFELNKDSWEIGETITGNVILRKDAAVAVESVKVRIVGQEWYRVTDSYDVPENKRSKSKIIFDTQWLTISSTPKAKEPAGESRYPIKIKLATDLSPSTNVLETARIYYEIQCEAHAGAPLVASKDLFILKALLNEPVAAFVDKKTFFMKDPITLRCLPDKREYHTNDHIVLDLSVDNRSPKEITRIFVRLVSKLKYGSNKDSKNILTLEITKPKLPILSGQKYEEMITLEGVPENIPASSSSQNIKVEYLLLLTTEFFSGGEWETKMPIFIIGSPPHIEDLNHGYIQRNEGAMGNPEVIVIADNNNNNNNSNANLPVPVPSGGYHQNQTFASDPPFSAANHIPITFDFSDQNMPLLRGGFPYGHPAYYGATSIYKPTPVSLFVPKKSEHSSDFPPVNPEVYS